MGNLAARYAADQAPQDPKLNVPAIPAFEPIRRAKRETKVRAAVDTKVAAARKAVKMGRPRTVEDEPWKTAGVSRSTWFRQQRASRISK